MEPELIYIELEGGNKAIIDIKKIALAVMRGNNGQIEIWMTGDNAPVVATQENAQKLWNLIKSRAIEL